MPLVDVMLVLLIIFMVTAPMIQRGIDVNLPVAPTLRTIAGERVFVTVPLTIARIASCTSATSRSASRCFRSACARRMETSTDKQVYLRGDGGRAVSGSDGRHRSAQGAGVENVGIVAKLPDEK